MQGPIDDKESMTKLIVALDYDDPKKAAVLVDDLSGEDVIFKVGLELFVSAGSTWVKSLVSRKKKVFLDLKLHDIPNTVSKAAVQAAELGVSMFTLHLQGGQKMIEQTRNALEHFGADRPLILGVSVLTSFDEDTWKQTAGAVGLGSKSIASSVKGLVSLGVEAGVDGVVCSPLELASLNSEFKDLYTVVPGIRPKGSDAGDQVRVMTPAQAKAVGAKAIVVGRPITQSSDPIQMTKSILQELGS